ncbi:DinB family protein [Neobacillus sp. 114]|uniref:DinB family protein n=1 Tax=Neobacillus sp. 114 TaxID=3048535 RepID=UPI001C222396|nr:DinB family protein [Neobacillus sp. 114]MBU8917843.1 DinB family protein [Bacillus sp. FJAT-29953]
MVQRPNNNEFPEYYVPYVQLVPEGDLLATLKESLEEVVSLFEGISEEEAHFRYESGKWSIKEVLGHMADTERIMSYRLLRVGRGDKTPLAGFNENDYVAGAQMSELPLQSILSDFIAVRKASITLIENMPESAWTNVGNANGMEVTARAIAYIIAGHAIHHRSIVTERYLSKLK